MWRSWIIYLGHIRRPNFVVTNYSLKSYCRIHSSSTYYTLNNYEKQSEHQDYKRSSWAAEFISRIIRAHEKFKISLLMRLYYPIHCILNTEVLQKEAGKHWEKSKPRNPPYISSRSFNFSQSSCPESDPTHNHIY